MAEDGGWGAARRSPALAGGGRLLGGGHRDARLPSLRSGQPDLRIRTVSGSVWGGIPVPNGGYRVHRARAANANLVLHMQRPQVPEPGLQTAATAFFLPAPPLQAATSSLSGAWTNRWLASPSAAGARTGRELPTSSGTGALPRHSSACAVLGMALPGWVIVAPGTRAAARSSHDPHAALEGGVVFTFVASCCICISGAWRGGAVVRACEAALSRLAHLMHDGAPGRGVVE